jgi:hypothetical protein
VLSTNSIGVGTCRFFCDAPQDWELEGRGVRRTVPISSPGSSYWYCNNDSSRQPIKHRHRHSSVVEVFCRCCQARKREKTREREREKINLPIRKKRENIVFFLSFFVYLFFLECLFCIILKLWKRTPEV